MRFRMTHYRRPAQKFHSIAMSCLKNDEYIRICFSHGLDVYLHAGAVVDVDVDVDVAQLVVDPTGQMSCKTISFFTGRQLTS
jgi:hypothetical protein